MWATYTWVKGTLSLLAACWMEPCTTSTPLNYYFACTVGFTA